MIAVENPSFRASGNGPICLIGIAEDPVLRAIATQLARRGEPYFVFDQNRFPRDFHVDYGMTSDGRLTGRLETPKGSYPIGDLRSAYVRLLGISPQDSSRGNSGRYEQERFFALDHLTRLWRVPTIGLLRPCGSNFSKPYQISLIATPRISVPATLLTSRSASVPLWQKQRGAVSFKSISSERSICMRLSGHWKRRLGRIHVLPVQFQEYVEGLDIRVHVAGDSVYALAIATGTSDYRFSNRYFGQKTKREKISLPGDVCADLIRISRNLGLVLSGIDLRLTEEGEYFCFEVNPTPGFAYFDQEPDYPIANSVCDLLVGLTHV